MELLSVETFDEAELLSAIRKTPLMGFDGALVYADATITLDRRVATDELVPAQRYVLRPNVQRVLDLREALLPHGVDVFALDGGVRIRTSEAPDEDVPLLPPIVEESYESDGRRVLLVNDGIHRVFAARLTGSPISVVAVRDVPRQYPYYAYALQGGWSDAVMLDELPDTFVKKTYRDPDNYIALFRNFNAVFPGVQAVRKRTNPPTLRRGG